MNKIIFSSLILITILSMVMMVIAKNEELFLSALLWAIPFTIGGFRIAFIISNSCSHKQDSTKGKIR